MGPEIILYGNRPVTSPYVMAVYVALKEKGLDFEFKQINLDAREQHSPDYVSHSVTNRVPTLFCDGQYLSESSAITEYLDERFAPPTHAPIYPSDLFMRARVRMVQALIRSDFMPIRIERSTETVFQNSPARPLSNEAEREKARLERIALTLVADGRAFLTGAFSIADVDLSTMLMRLVANRDPMPKVLVDYAKGIWRRPSVTSWLALTAFQAD